MEHCNLSLMLLWSFILKTMALLERFTVCVLTLLQRGVGGGGGWGCLQLGVFSWSKDMMRERPVFPVRVDTIGNGLTVRACVWR